MDIALPAALSQQPQSNGLGPAFSRAPKHRPRSGSCEDALNPNAQAGLVAEPAEEEPGARSRPGSALRKRVVLRPFASGQNPPREDEAAGAAGVVVNGAWAR